MSSELRDSNSFSHEIKREILGLPFPMKCCQEVFLFSLLKNVEEKSVLSIPNRVRDSFVQLLGRVPTARNGISLDAGTFVVSSPLEERLRKTFPERMGSGDEALPRKHCARAFLKGTFVRAGYFQDPQKNYHLEIPLETGMLAGSFRRVVPILRVPFKFCDREGVEIAYLKSKSGLRRFISSLELFDRLLQFDDLLATRDLLGQVNRQVNFETANINKSVEASEKLTGQIRQILEYPDQEIWSDALRDLGLKRIQFPLDSLEKLGRRCIPPLSKSAVNHRLRRISALHARLYGERK